jgi:sec-independent protein translocase protein TatB
MFDVGFSELLVIGLVALIVLGPERLPKVARTVGHLLGRMQRYAASVKADIEREIQLEELKRLEAQIQAQARELEREMQQQAASIAHEIDGARRAVETEPTAAGAEPAAAGAEPAAAGAEPAAAGAEPAAAGTAPPERVSEEAPVTSSSPSDPAVLLPSEAAKEPLATPGALTGAGETIAAQPARVFLNNGLRS